MVLKVVRGKILETLELSCLSAACGSVSEQRGMTLAGSGAWNCQVRGTRYKLSKSLHYLIDNIYNLILSSLMGRVQEESGRTEEQFPNWNTGAWERWVTTASSFSGGEPRPSGAWTGHPRELNERDCPGHPPYSEFEHRDPWKSANEPGLSGLFLKA